MCKFCFGRTSCPLDVVRIIGGILYLLLRPALYCTHSVDITHQVSLVVYMKQFWLFRLLSVSMIFFRLITSPELHDVTLLSEEGTELRCHKCILIARLGTYENLTIFNTFLFVYLR